MASVSRWPAPERPRERLLTLGAGILTDAELLALVVGASSRGGGGVLDTCRELLDRFQGLPGLGRSHPSELMQVRGIGAARACALAASLELARRSDGSALLRGEPISCADDVFRRVRPRLAGLQQETFWMLALDAKHRMLATRQVALGSATSVEVHPREVFQAAVRESAAAIIVVHNHPSGDPEPSREDEQLTGRLQQAGQILGIPMLDHLIIAGRSFVSLAARGLLISPRAEGWGPSSRVSETGLPRRSSGDMGRRTRYPLEAAIYLQLPGAAEQAARTRDLSEWGIGLETDSQLPEGSTLQARLPLPGGGPTIHFLGVVVWSQPAREQGEHCACGLRIQTLSVAHLLALRESLAHDAPP